VSRISHSLSTALLLAAALGVSAVAQAADLPSAKSVAGKAAPQPKSVRFDSARCNVPDSLVTQEQTLPRVGFKLRNDLPIKIVAIGSSSTAGHGASSPSHSYPARLAVELLELWPRAQLTVVNRGVGGDRTTQMMTRFERDVLAEQPDLVVWQVGTNESLAGDTIHAMRELILEGIDTLEMAGIDVILMSPQYAPRFNEKPDHLLRVEAVRATGREKHVGVFRRFEIMQNWVARDNMTIDAMISQDGLHMNDLSYGCTAHLLARQIAAASSAMPVMATRPPAVMPAAGMAAPVSAQAVRPQAAPAIVPNIPR
jgi:acyl-CoA thioesterase-1